eukprot:scaffold1377_cov390-Prasinococcus_capsulatus_cf.AAC.2
MTPATLLTSTSNPATASLSSPHVLAGCSSLVCASSRLLGSCAAQVTGATYGKTPHMLPGRPLYSPPQRNPWPARAACSRVLMVSIG